MKKMPKKGALLFGAALAVCVLVVPSIASAASWSAIGTTHQLFSSNLDFANVGSPVGSTCAATELDVDVASAAVLEITSASFTGCGGTGQGALGCLATTRGTGFPWTVTAPTTSNIQIHGVQLDVRYENNGGFACPVAGLNLLVTGTLTGGSWDPSATGSSRRVTLNTATGLTSHSAMTRTPTLVRATFNDTAGTLDLFD